MQIRIKKQMLCGGQCRSEEPVQRNLENVCCVKRWLELYRMMGLRWVERVLGGT